ncbi:MAG: TOBE domain-containing protein [Silicimonas sp.]|nr:TOBE domain-containing protein [Silicimonas sp.]
MDHGRIAQVATPTEIYERPNSRYVASFIGEVNILDGRVADSGADHVDIVCQDTGCQVRAAYGADISNGAQVSVAIRPEKLRQDTQFELMDIQETTGTTFVIVTHDQEEAMTVASRVAVMDHGLIKQVATPERIYEQPNSVYVADFIGDVNLIGGRIAAVNGAAELDWAEGRTPLIGQTGAGLAKGDKATFAIRPEKIAISADEPEARNRVRGKILDIGYLGNLSTYHVELPEGPVVKCEVGNRSRLERRDFTWEDEVWLSWTAPAGLVLPE